MSSGKTKRFRMFAGPNGSGKSHLIEQVRKKINLGYLINADLVEEKLNRSKFLDCNDFLPCELDQKTWNNYLFNPHILNRIEEYRSPPVLIKENIMVANSTITSYDASIICEIFRDILLQFNEDFSFETVMSHESKIEFIRKANENNFKSYLYFICTSDLEINLSRVRNRALKGGHQVPEDKIKTRFYRSLELLLPAFKGSHRAYVIDNSLEDDKLVIIEKDGDKITQNGDIPGWVTQYLLDNLKSN